jgi:fucose 4-O-acetylase-like acetyltransferase
MTVYSNSDFWLNSPSLILIKLGVLLMMLALSYVWNLNLSPQRWSMVRQFGTTSLLVYWVHVELVYGKAFWYFKESLSVPEACVMSVFIIFLMLGLSLLRTNFGAVKVCFGLSDTLTERVPGN